MLATRSPGASQTHLIPIFPSARLPWLRRSSVGSAVFVCYCGTGVQIWYFWHRVKAPHPHPPFMSQEVDSVFYLDLLVRMFLKKSTLVGELSYITCCFLYLYLTPGECQHKFIIQW